LFVLQPFRQEVLIMVLRVTAALAATFAFSAPAIAQPAVVNVEVNSFYFTPKPIRLHPGQPVTLNFINRSNSSHDFTAKKFFAASHITSGAAPEGEIDLKGHETKSITLVPAAGTYSAHCSHFMHATMGMTEEIIVQ
jgi:plastocyanin